MTYQQANNYKGSIFRCNVSAREDATGRMIVVHQ